MTRILVPLFGNQKTDTVALGAAGLLAKRNGALIDARLFCRELSSVIPLAGEGLTSTVIEQLKESAQAQIDRQTEVARSSFDAWRVRDEIPLGDVASQDETAANFATRQGHLPTAIIEPAKISDVAIFVSATKNEDSDKHGLAEAVLLDALRPLLLVPAKGVKTIASNIMIAWNGSAEAARAISMSQNLLKQADSVTIVTVGKGADPKEIAVTLQSNGIAATPHVVRAGAADVSQALQIQAEKFKADLVIIGAYSHNRLRESIFGGVTRDLFARTTISTLMIH
jgi:nucleotide-binding universal stress UspA family protein